MQSYGQVPNFVIVVLDDMGWTGTSVAMDKDVSATASDYYQTPNISSLASMGMVFTQAYAPAPKCSPSRASILTGRSTARNGFTNTDNQLATDKPLVEATTQTEIDPAWTTYAEWLKSTGLNYRTAHLGKWHLGKTDSQSPSSNGFDVSDGNTTNSNGNSSAAINNDPKKMFDLTDRAIIFMQQAVSDGVPFVIQLSHYSVHTTVESTQATWDLYNDASQRPPGVRHDNASYGAMTEDTDTAIGQLLDALAQMDVMENTYIFLVSDNGGQMNVTDNYPLTFGKTFIYEGGIRVPFIAVGPGIAADTYSTQAVVAYDLFPTMAALTGSTQDLPANVDGQSIVSALQGNGSERDGFIYFHSPHYDNNRNKVPRSAIIDEDHKLLIDYETGKVALFDLALDVGESTDISGTFPDYTRELVIALRDHLKDAGAAMPSLDPTYASFLGSGDDVDGDGLNDAWEFRELLTYTYGADDDPDGDGISNLSEMNLGLDPLIADEAGLLASSTVPADIVLSPNPTTGEVHIHGANAGVRTVRIYNAAGQLVITHSHGAQMSVSSLVTGTYSVHIYTGGDMIARKLVVK